MSIPIKDEQAIAKMRLAGQAAAQILEMIEPHVVPGITTDELNTLCYDFMVNDLDVIPALLNYKGFPKSICTSPNHVICHGIPGKKKLKKGDILNIDVTIIKDGYHGDTSKMYTVGTPSILAKRLIDRTQFYLYEAIKLIQPGRHLGDVGHLIQTLAEKDGFSVVREYCGHGIGEDIHEDPQVLHYGKAKTGDVLRPGMTFTIEPMINAGKRHVKLLPDEWTVVTKDHSLSAQWEHTLLVTKDGVEVLTLRSEESIL